MTEQVTVRRSPEQFNLGKAIILDEQPVSVLAASTVEDGRPYFLPQGTEVVLHIEASVTCKKQSFSVGPVELGEGVEVVLVGSPFAVQHKLLEGPVTMIFVPYSAKKINAAAERERAGNKHHVDAVFASSITIQREDARLAQELLIGREHLLIGQGIETSNVIKIGISPVLPVGR